MHHRHHRPMAVAAGWLLAVASIGSGCAGSTPPPTGPPAWPGAVRVASFNFPESELVAEIYGQALIARGVPVRMELDLGTRELVLPAFQQGLVDVVPEYMGSALQALEPEATGNMADRSFVAGRLQAVLARWHGTLLDPSPAQDQNGLVVTREAAAEYGLETISDLRRVAAGMTFTAPPECPERPYCLQGLERVYGLRFRSQLPLATEGERVTALEQHVADVALLFTTNPDVARHDLVLLRDDRHLEPAENLAPVVSDRVRELYGARLTQTLDAVSTRLSSEELMFLNWRVSVGGRSASEEAHGWLVRRGLAARS